MNLRPLGYEQYDARLCHPSGSHPSLPTSVHIGPASLSILPVSPLSAHPAAFRLQIRLQEQTLTCGVLLLQKGSGVQVGKDGQDTAVVVVGWWEVEFGEDGRAVLADCLLGDD